MVIHAHGLVIISSTMHLSHPHRTAEVQEEKCSWFHCSATPADDRRRPVLKPFAEDVFLEKCIVEKYTDTISNYSWETQKYSWQQLTGGGGGQSCNNHRLRPQFLALVTFLDMEHQRKWSCQLTMEQNDLFLLLLWRASLMELSLFQQTFQFPIIFTFSSI